MWVGALVAVSWWLPPIVFAAGAAMLFSAMCETAPNAVGSFLIFFFPWE
jgi:hypothetical protein